MKLSISRASLFACLLRVVPWVPHELDKSCEQQPRWVLSHTQVKCSDLMNEISCSFLSRVHIWSTYSAKIHLAANEIIFRVIRGYGGTFLTFVISNLYMYLAIIGSCICAINIWNSSRITFNLLDNDCNIPTNFSQNQLSKRENTFSNYVGI